jgi:hypothetical protein
MLRTRWATPVRRSSLESTEDYLACHLRCTLPLSEVNGQPFLLAWYHAQAAAVQTILPVFRGSGSARLARAKAPGEHPTRRLNAVLNALAD